MLSTMLNTQEVHERWPLFTVQQMEHLYRAQMALSKSHSELRVEEDETLLRATVSEQRCLQRATAVVPLGLLAIMGQLCPAP